MSASSAASPRSSRMRPRQSGNSRSIVLLYVVEDAERAGRAIHTIFVDDLDARVADIASRGIEPDERVTYPGKARKAIFANTTATRSVSGGPID